MELLAKVCIFSTFWSNSLLWTLPWRIRSSISETTVVISEICCPTSFTVALIFSECSANVCVDFELSATQLSSVSEERCIAVAELLSDVEQSDKVAMMPLSASYKEFIAVAIFPISLLVLIQGVRRLLFSSFKLLSWIIASSTYNRGLTLIAIVINASTLMIKTKMIHITRKLRIFLWTFS